MKNRNLLIIISLFIFSGFIYASCYFYRKSRESDKPFISVIIPVYNTEEYLRKCLDSVVNQSYKNIEIICVNDGSTDNSLKILNEYAKDNRVKIIDKRNGGVSSARNVGLDNAKGEYISFVDSDDYIELNTYEICHNNLSNGDYDILTFGYVNEPAKELRTIIPGDFDACEFLDLRFPIGYSVNSIYKKKIIDENNIRFDENVSIGEDNLFILMFLLKSSKLRLIDNRFYHYVDRGPGRYKVEQSLTSGINFAKSLIEFCTKNKISSKYKWALEFCINVVHENLNRIDENDIEKRAKYSRSFMEIVKNNDLENVMKGISGIISDKLNFIKSYL